MRNTFARIMSRYDAKIPMATSSSTSPLNNNNNNNNNNNRMLSNHAANYISLMATRKDNTFELFCSFTAIKI